MRPPALSSLATNGFRRRLADGELLLNISPFVLRVQSRVSHIGDLIGLMYGDSPLGSPDQYQDFHLSVRYSSPLRRWIKPNATFDGDGESPFAPMPAGASFPLFEWGFNWRVATTAHQYLMLHAAVVERDGVTAVMPALPGSGKSTLAAALMCRGWRLLSDEFGLLRPGTTLAVPFPRPVPLKNESIAVISEFAPDAVIGPTFTGTRKGDVAHVRPSRASVAGATSASPVTHIIFPRYEAHAAARFHAIPEARAFIKLSANSFNYQMLGVQGFRTVAALIRATTSQSFVYGHLDDAVSAFDTLRPGQQAGSLTLREGELPLDDLNDPLRRATVP